MKQNFHQFWLSASAEHRMLHFGKFDLTPEERAAEAEKGIDETMKAKKKLSGSAADRLPKNRLDAPIVDEQRAQDILEAELFAFLMQNTPESAFYKGIVAKAEILEQSCPGRGTLLPLKFGLRGGELTIVSADDAYIDHALSRVAAEIQTKESPAPSAAALLTEYDGEPAEQVVQRAEAMQRIIDKRTALREAFNYSEAQQWQVLKEVLRKFQSSFEKTVEATALVKKDPTYILQISNMEWVAQHPLQYQALFVGAVAKKPELIPLILEANPNILKGILAAKIMEASKENPLVLQYLPAESKQADAPKYRKDVIAGALQNGNVLLFAAKEFDKFWKDVPATDLNNYTKLCKIAVNQSPTLFFQQYEWLRPNNAALLIAVEAALTSDARIAIVRAMTEYNLVAFNRLPGGYASFIENLIKAEPAAALTVVRNPILFGIIKDHDERLYKKLRTILSASDADVRWVRSMFPDVMNDEDLVADILAELQKALDGGDYSAVRDGRVDIASIPEHVWKADANMELFIKIFSAQGDLFAHAPSWMQGKKEYALPIIINNASAYVHAAESVRSDPEVLYAALLAEKKNHKGEMQWKDVPVSLQNRLRDAGFNGVVTDYDNMLRVLILGLDAKKAPLTPKQVHSFMDSWTKDMRKDKELVTAYLERALPGHPEFYLDASPLKGDKDPGLRDDFFFARKMVGINQKVLGFITTEQHKAFDASHKVEYRAMVASIVRFDPALFEKIPEDMRNQAEFIMDIINRTGRPELLQFAPESVRDDVPFLISVLQAMIAKNDFKALRAFFMILPPDTVMDVLLKDGGGIVLKLFEIFDDVETIVPPMVLRGNLLYQILLKYKEKENRKRMSEVLLKATPIARFEYFKEHPEDILYILEKNPSGIARLVYDSLITVDLLATLAEGYAVGEIHTLFSELLTVKPMVLVGLLRRRPDLWENIGDAWRVRMLPLMDAATVKMLSVELQKSTDEKKEFEKKSALDDLLLLRKEAKFLLSLAVDGKGSTPPILWQRKYFTAQSLFDWLEKDYATPLSTKDALDASALYRSFVQKLRFAIDPATASTDILTKVQANIDRLDITDKGIAQVVALRDLMKAQWEKPKARLSEEQSKQRDLFLKTLHENFNSSVSQIASKAENFDVFANKDDLSALRSYVKSAEKLIPVFIDCVGMAQTYTENPIQRQLLVDLWSRNRNSIIIRLMEARKEVARLTLPDGVAETEPLYNLDATSLQFVTLAVKYLGINRVEFAKTLDVQGTRNARLLSEEYLPMLKTPQQWEKVIAIAEAFGSTRASLAVGIEAGRLDVFANCLMLSQEKHSAEIIKAIRADVSFPLALYGGPGTLDIQEHRSMIIMASREMGAAFDAGKLKTIWQAIRARQVESFRSSPDILNDIAGKSAKTIDVFVIAEDDGEEGFSRKVIERSADLTVALNRQKAGVSGATESHLVADRQKFRKALEEFKELAKRDVYAKDGDRHLVLRIMTHGKPSSGNALDIDPGAIASELDPASTTILYTSCNGGRHLTEMFGKTLKGSRVNVLAEVSGTVTPIHTDDMIDAKIEGAYEKDPDGNFVADFNGDDVVSLPEAFHWLDRNSSFQDPQGFAPGGSQFTGTTKGKSVEGLA